MSIDPTRSPLRRSGGAARADFALPGAHDLNDYGAKGDGVTDDCSAFTAAEHATLPGRDGRIVIPPAEYLGKNWTITSSGVIVQGMGVGYFRTGTLRTATLQLEEVGLLHAS